MTPPKDPAAADPAPHEDPYAADPVEYGPTYNEDDPELLARQGTPDEETRKRFNHYVEKYVHSGNQKSKLEPRFSDEVFAKILEFAENPPPPPDPWAKPEPVTEADRVRAWADGLREEVSRAVRKLEWFDKDHPGFNPERIMPTPLTMPEGWQRGIDTYQSMVTCPSLPHPSPSCQGEQKLHLQLHYKWQGPWRRRKNTATPMFYRHGLSVSAWDYGWTIHRGPIFKNTIPRPQCGDPECMNPRHLRLKPRNGWGGNVLPEMQERKLWAAWRAFLDAGGPENAPLSKQLTIAGLARRFNVSRPTIRSSLLKRGWRMTFP